MASSTPRTLGFAVWSDNLDLVRELLDQGVAVDEYEPGREDPLTPLMESVNEHPDFYDADRAAVTQLLLAHGADVSRRDSERRTALHYAAGAGRLAVELLLVAEADPSARDSHGSTPLHEAINRCSADAVVALCGGGADPLATDANGHSAIDLFLASEGEFTSEEREFIRAAFGLK